MIPWDEEHHQERRAVDSNHLDNIEELKQTDLFAYDEIVENHDAISVHEQSKQHNPSVAMITEMVREQYAHDPFVAPECEKPDDENDKECDKKQELVKK